MYGRVLLVSRIIPFQAISTIVSLHYSDDFSMKTINEPVLILGLIWFRGFRGEDLNVKVYDVRRTTSDGKSSHCL
jgi:hypothetical protein